MGFQARGALFVLGSNSLVNLDRVLLRAVYSAEYQAVTSRVRLLHDAHQAQD